MQMYMMYLYVPEMKLMDQGLDPEHDEHTHTHTQPKLLPRHIRQC